MSGRESPRLQFPSLLMDDLRFPEGQNLTLRVDSWSSGVKTLQIRGFNRLGTISHDHVTAGDRSLTQTTFSIPEFPLFLRVANSVTSAERGECFCRVVLLLAGFEVATLVSGYVYANFNLSYPLSGTLEMSEGRGRLRAVSGSNPAAGAEFAETVPTNARWRLMAFFAIFVADATVTNRRPSLTFDDGTNVYAKALTAGNIAASETTPCCWINVGDAETVANQVDTGHMPEAMIIEQGDVIRSVTNNLQAGDNWGACQIYVEEWLRE